MIACTSPAFTARLMPLRIALPSTVAWRLSILSMRRRVLVPELDLVAVRVLDEGEGQALSEIAALLEPGAGRLDRGERVLDRLGMGQPKAEMQGAARLAG